MTHYLLRLAARGTTFPLLIYFPDSSLLEEGCVPDRASLPSTGAHSPRLGSRSRSLAGSNPCFCPFLVSSPTGTDLLWENLHRDRPLLSTEVTGTFKHHLLHSSRGSFQEDIRHYYHLITFRNPTCLLLFSLPAAFFSSMKSLASDPADQLQPASWDGD